MVDLSDIASECFSGDIWVEFCSVLCSSCCWSVEKFIDLSDICSDDWADSCSECSDEIWTDFCSSFCSGVASVDFSDCCSECSDEACADFCLGVDICSDDWADCCSDYCSDFCS